MNLRARPMNDPQVASAHAARANRRPNQKDPQAMPRTKTLRTRSKQVSPLTDEQLMAMAKQGDLSAFESIVNRHKQDVYNLAFSILRHREDAEEAAQDTFLKL